MMYKSRLDEEPMPALLKRQDERKAMAYLNVEVAEYEKRWGSIRRGEKNAAMMLIARNPSLLFCEAMKLVKGDA